LLQGEQAALEIARGELDQGALVPETVRGQALELVHRAPRALRVSGSHEPEREAGADDRVVVAPHGFLEGCQGVARLSAAGARAAGVVVRPGELGAQGLVLRLLAQTLPRCPGSVFLVAFGACEVLLGLSFLLPWLTPVSVTCGVLHMCTTVLPLVVLPDVTWTAPFVPTLEGQYILKNAALLALALGLLRPDDPSGPSRKPRAAFLLGPSARQRVIERRAEDGIPTREVLG